MEQALARQTARTVGTDLTNVVREYWEVVLLKGLFESPTGRSLVFKGGTALRLVHGSPRYSEELDFSYIGQKPGRAFRGLVNRITAPHPELLVTDCAEKFFTCRAEVKVTVGYLPMPFRVKVEISKRLSRVYRSELKLVSSPTAALQVLTRTATLEQLYQDKLACLGQRLRAKDIFDLWFLGQRLGVPFDARKVSLPKRILTRDLRKYLPRSFWPSIDELST